jgi:hypothetical protein
MPRWPGFRPPICLENTHASDQPDVLRGVPHTLGLSQSIVSGQPGLGTPPAGRVTAFPDFASLDSSFQAVSACLSWVNSRFSGRPTSRRLLSVERPKQR